MLDLFQALMAMLFCIALLYGLVAAFLNWKSTVPAGADSDFELAHHQLLGNSLI